MRRCPHCRSESLPWVTLALSSESAPVRCADCKGLSHRDTGFPLLLGALSWPGLLAAAIAALHLQAWWPIVLFASILAAASSLSLLLPATRTTRATAQRVRRVQAIAIVVLLAVAAMSVAAGL